MSIVVDRPADHQIWQRSELLAGRVDGGEDVATLAAWCGGEALTLRPCWHPSGQPGFWSELVLQRHRDAVREGSLGVEFVHDGRRVATVRLQVSPLAFELAGSHPLDLAVYPVPSPPRAENGGSVPLTIVFPGLGAVGGSSLNALARTTMLREGWATAVYDEANVAALWSAARAASPTPVRWVDGHGCYAAADPRRESAARVTLLRDPLRRLVSLFNYGSLVHPEDFGSWSFDAFVAAGASRRYSQAAALLRAAGRASEAELDGVALQQAARAELQRGYALVGIAEDFEASIFLLCRLAGWARIGMWRRVLAAPRAVDANALTSATRGRLAEDLAVDLELYEEARTVFAARLAAASFGPELERYRDAATHQSELSATAKAVECLRWRQVLADHRTGMSVSSAASDGGSG